MEVGLNPMQTSEGRFVIASVVDVSERKRGELEAPSSVTKWRISRA